MTIRPLRTQDKDAWRGLWSAYLAFYDASVSEAVYDATFSRLLDPARPQQQALLAQRDGQAVGLVHFIFHPHNWKIEEVCYLQDLFVSPQARGEGLGRQLIEAVYSAADAQGSPNVYWMTQEFNTAARQLYDRIAQKTPFVQYKR